MKHSLIGGNASLHLTHGLNAWENLAMDVKQFEEMQAQIERRYRHKLEAAKAEYDQAMSALAILRSAFQYSSPDGELVHIGSLQSTPQTSLMGAIREIIPQIDGQFDINTIRHIVEDEYPLVKKPLNPTTVSNHLRTLWCDGLITQLRAGQGTKPSIYTISKKWLDQLHEEEMENAPIVR